MKKQYQDKMKKYICPYNYFLNAISSHNSISCNKDELFSKSSFIKGPIPTRYVSQKEVAYCLVVWILRKTDIFNLIDNNLKQEWQQSKSK